MTTNKLFFTALAAASALAMSAPAQAQVTGAIATANPTIAILSTKAFQTASQQISTTHKAAFDAASARQAALQREVEPLLTALDTNKDKQLSDAELQAARTANNPNLAKIETAQRNANAEIQRQVAPAARAEAYAIEMISQKYNAAQTAVITAKRVGVILTPEAFVYAPEAADITPAITAEIDRTTPTVAIAPPAGWNPSQQTLQIQEELQRLKQMAALRSQQQRPAAGAPGAPAPAPAPTQPAPSGR